MAERPQEPEVETTEPPRPTTPAAVALALDRAGKGDAKLDFDAGAFLREQTRMLRMQMEHLEEQRRLNVKHLQWRVFGDRIRGALQVLSLLAGGTVAAFVATLVWSAHQDRALVVEPFSVPPDLARRGLTGPVTATLLMDRISELDARAQSVRAGANYRSDWGGEIKVEIPATGISLSELERWLRKVLGHETVISGDLFHTGDGLTLAVRAGHQAALTARGPESGLDALLDRAAEAVFAATQPYRYSKYLESQGRLAEALAVARRIALTGPETWRRAWAWAQVANLLELEGDMPGGVAAAREALALDPHLALGALNAQLGEAMLGHDEEALRGYGLSRRLLRAPRADVSPEARASLPTEAAAVAANLVGDYAGSETAWRALEQKPDFQGAHDRILGARAFARAQNHDGAGSRLLRAVAPDPDIDATYARWFDALNLAVIPQYFEAVEAGDWSAALAHLDRASAAADARGAEGAVERARFLDPRRAFVLARLGRLAEARALAARLPLDCYLCLRMRGKVEASAGDEALADAWFERATRFAPSLPFAWTDWGERLMARGDLTGAEAKFAHAHGLSPRFADPLALWGEALLRQGQPAHAEAKLAAAAALAPRWGRLRLLWGLALDGEGRRADAARQYRAAAALDLAPPARAVLDRRLAEAGA